MLALAEADTNVAHILRNHFTFIERYVRIQSDPRQAKWLQAALDGAIFGLATTELDRAKVGGGGPWHTTLTTTEGGYRLNGTKFYSTGTLYADFILVRADIVDGNQVSVVVPVERQGVERVDDWDGIGQRVTGTGTTNFRDVFIAEDEVIGDEKEASFLLPCTSTIAQLIVTTVVAGAAKAALRDAKALAKGRTRTFYYANAETADEDPILQQSIGQIAAYAFAAETLVLAAAVKLDRVQAARDAGEDFDPLSQQASLAAAKAKVVVDELALKATTALFDVGGASAATQKRNLDRHWRNALDARLAQSRDPEGAMDRQARAEWHPPARRLLLTVRPQQTPSEDPR